MEDSTEYRYGILKIAGHAGFVQGMIEKYLPPEHRIVESRDIVGDPLYRGYLVQGPDMPQVEAGSYAPMVALLFGLDASSGQPFCCWEHMAHKRWPAHPEMQTLMAD